jgi:hypothetical protein
MDRATANGSMQAVGTVAALGLFLPGISRAWDLNPSDPEAIYRCRTGEAVYLGATAAVCLLASYGNGSPAPFIFGFGLALLIVGVQEHALRHRSRDAQA